MASAELEARVNVQPTSQLAREQHELRRLVAQSATFQARVDQAGNPALAAKRIYLGGNWLDGVDVDGHALARPYAIVMRPPGPLWALAAGGDKNYLRRRGNLWLYLADNSRFPNDPDDDQTDFCNFVGGVDEDMAALAGYDTWLPIASIELVGTPQHSPIELGDPGSKWWQAWYGLEWGLS